MVTASISVAMPLLGDVSHLGQRVSRTRRHARHKGPVQPFKIRSFEGNIEGADVLFYIVWPLCSRDGHNVVTLGKHPGERDMRCSTSLGCGELIEGLEQRHIAGQVFLLKARMGAPPVLLYQVVKFTNGATEKATTQWGVCHVGNPQRAAGWQPLLLRVARPK